MALFAIDSHWRDSARTPMFFFVDARATFPLLFFLVHIRLWTFITALIFILFFAFIARFGFSVVVFLRMIRTTLAGKRKLSKPWWREDKLR